MEVGELLAKLEVRVAGMAAGQQALSQVLRDEEKWLERAERAVNAVREFREHEMRRRWPAVLRRWTVAIVYALASAVAFGSGYAWASRPHEAELASLRTRVEILDTVARRVLTMTPAERRQFDVLMRLSSPSRR